MFERFTHPARVVVVHAQEHAREMRSDRVGTAHLLAGLAQDRSSAAGNLLAEHGVRFDRLRARAGHMVGAAALDAEALACLGIDVDEVRAKVEESFGPGALDVPAKRRPSGHIRFDDAAKKTLELALREAVHRTDGEITDLHLLLGALRADPSVAEYVLAVDTETLRAAAYAALDSRAA